MIWGWPVEGSSPTLNRFVDEPHRRPDGYQIRELFHIAVVHTDAALGDGLANGAGLVRPVNAVAGKSKAQPAGAHRIVGPGRIGSSPFAYHWGG